MNRYDQTHSNRFFTFRDFYEEGEAPDFTKLEDGQVRDPSYNLVDTSSIYMLGIGIASQVIKVMELCSGVGGTGFLGQRQKMHGKEVELQVRWAFDINDDASAAYQINDPTCEVYVRGIDESLMLSKVRQRRCKMERRWCVCSCTLVGYLAQIYNLAGLVDI